MFIGARRSCGFSGITREQLDGFDTAFRIHLKVYFRKWEP